ncbi:unnamed protein product [Rotaria sp. Silwood1]|nr:unnamed protein product [Rotaria sp. Silwood1]
MSDEGLNNKIGIDTKTGFVYGGNRWNFGTWMDKMGSSDKANNKGQPTTPRDGSVVKLVGLSRTVIACIIQMNQEAHYPYDSVETSTGIGGKMTLLFPEWLNQIDENFEKEFWIDETNSSEYVNRRQIYKDTIHSSLRWTDFQLRPNFIIAAVIVRKYGIKTLDSSDYNYVGGYVSNDDSYDYKRAHRFNYHNGPEWLWLTGYYIRAKLYWSKQQNDQNILKQTIKHCKKLLTQLMDLFYSNDWKGLPELTNADGNICPDSCTAQAWSAATLSEAFYDLYYLQI